MSVKNETPLMKQYKEIKSENEDSILFFRLGDFYEMFFDDAVVCSKELGITLTSRNKEKGQSVPLAGVPYHSAAGYINKLVNKGYKVSICEQVEDPKEAKGIVKREVVRVITPGTIIDSDSLDDKSNNYLLAVNIHKNMAGIAFIDITTGDFNCFEIESDRVIEKVINEIHRIDPREIIIDSESYLLHKNKIDDYITISGILVNELSKIKYPDKIIKEYFNLISLESFGIEDKKYAIEASALAIEYLVDLQKDTELPINKICYDNRKDYMELNITTQKNLELIENPKDKTSYGTLLWVLDKCKTSMGSRLLKGIIKNPLTSIDKIKSRQNDVAFFIDEIIIREDIKELLKDIYDIERLIGKIIMGTENGRDLIALKKSLKSALEIKELISGNNIFDFDSGFIINLINLIENTIVEEPPFSIREGGIIKRGYNKELDELFNISENGKDYILTLELKEKELTGIKNLKIKYNKVFGYFLEVTKSNVSMVPDNYIRKQTLTNCERYITDELKKYESQVLNAKDKIEGLEYEIFKSISGEIKSFETELQTLAKKIAYIDVIISFADVAVKNSYNLPMIKEGYELSLKSARHPIVEKLIGDEFVANDVKFDEKERIIILTGPNMAGKSTFMKQAALIILMAQIGSYVPCDEASIGIVDKIFTRIGASDDLVSGQSTFMVEMSEVANIVNGATENSFIILDEVGRGTSTIDGLSIASSITKYLDKQIKAKTIFATHYHELTEMENECNYVTNFRIEVKETAKEVIFLHEIKKGGADKSYGVEVARLAGLPNEILSLAKKTLKKLEKDKIDFSIKGSQLGLFDNNIDVVEEKEVLDEKTKEIIDKLEKIDINSLTPIDALLELNRLKQLL